VWIGRNKRIVDISENVTPESYPATFKPKSPARYVLEIRAGEAKKAGWQEGTQLYFTTPKQEK
jgi:uncharacterized membrane protein (UPF0127 family)